MRVSFLRLARRSPTRSQQTADSPPCTSVRSRRPNSPPVRGEFPTYIRPTILGTLARHRKTGRLATIVQCPMATRARGCSSTVGSVINGAWRTKSEPSLTARSCFLAGTTQLLWLTVFVLFVTSCEGGESTRVSTPGASVPRVSMSVSPSAAAADPTSSPKLSSSDWTQVPYYMSSSGMVGVWVRADLAELAPGSRCGDLISVMVPTSTSVARKAVGCNADYVAGFKTVFRQDPEGILYVAAVELLLRFRASLDEVTEPAPRLCSDISAHFVRESEPIEDTDVLGTCWIEPESSTYSELIVGRVPLGHAPPQSQAPPRCLELVSLLTEPERGTEDAVCMIEY